MKEIADVLNTASGPKTPRLAAQKVFLKKRGEIWKDIQEGRFPQTYISAGNNKFVGAPRRTAIRCNFLLANKIALGSKFQKDRIANLAQRYGTFLLIPFRWLRKAPLLPAARVHAWNLEDGVCRGVRIGRLNPRQKELVDLASYCDFVHCVIDRSGDGSDEETPAQIRALTARST